MTETPNVIGLLTLVVEAEVTPGTPEQKARCEAIYQASLKEKQA